MLSATTICESPLRWFSESDSVVTQTIQQNKLPPLRFSVLAGSACFFWAFLAWLSVTPNQDILADAVQVQSLFADPRIVLSFPGQKHAGPIEYPFQLLAEWVAPGNFYVHTFPRVIFAFLTGFFTAKLFMQLFPNARQWSFLTAIAIGPAIMHGLSGPEGNSVGVWWLVGNYDTSWLLVVIGAFLLTRGVARDSKWLIFASGLSIGLGFFAHPNVMILIIPLGTLTLLLIRPGIRQLVSLLFGSIVGIFPAIISYLFFAGNNSWDPSHVPFFVRDFYLNALGLNGIPDYISVVLPYALGLPTSQTFFSATVQTAFTAVVLMAFLLTAVVGWFRALSIRVWPQPFVIISTAWLGAVVAIMLFVTFVDTVWFYATSLAIMFWITLGALPTVIKPRILAIGLTCALLTLEGISMLTHNRAYFTNFSENVRAKAEYQSQVRDQATILTDAGVEIIYGSYLDVIPIAYASSYNLRPISVRYNRFPLTDAEGSRILTVAVKAEPVGLWGEEGLAIAQSVCSPTDQILAADTKFNIYNCPGSGISGIG